MLELDHSHVYNQQDVVTNLRKNSFMQISTVLFLPAWLERILTPKAN